MVYTMGCTYPNTHLCIDPSLNRKRSACTYNATVDSHVPHFSFKVRPMPGFTTNDIQYHTDRLSYI